MCGLLFVPAWPVEGFEGYVLGRGGLIAENS